MAILSRDVRISLVTQSNLASLQIQKKRPEPQVLNGKLNSFHYNTKKIHKKFRAISPGQFEWWWGGGLVVVELVLDKGV
jgi:hypothetical protein